MNKLDNSQKEQLKEIVSYLQQKRQEKSLSLEQVASCTFIRLHILQALEAAEVEHLPELIYVQGFIRRYGNMLELDGDRLAKQLTKDSGVVAVKTSPSRQSEPKKSERKSKATWSILKGYWLYFTVIGTIILGGFSFFFRPSNSESTREISTRETIAETETSPPTVASSPVSEATETKVESSPPETTTINTQDLEEAKIEAIETNSPPVEIVTETEDITTETNAPLSVAVVLKGTSWLRIQVDGKTEYEGILKEGEDQIWTAQETLNIRAGNAGAVTYSLNQQPPQPLGALGEVKEVTLTPQ